MGWLSDSWDSVKSVAKAAWSKTKEVASNAVQWMAEKAETFVGSVTKVWEKVKPFISNVVRPALSVAAAWAAKSLPTFTWVAGAIKAFDLALGALVQWDESELAKKVKKAIDWVINISKKIKDSVITAEEVIEAEENQEIFSAAKKELRGDAAQSIDLAMFINNFALLKSRIHDVLENNRITDFEHYLRLRASQKLMSESQKHLDAIEDISEIEPGDLFLIEVGAKLLEKKPSLSDAEVVKLDEIIMERFQKKLIPFVFEELIMAWGVNLADMESEFHEKIKAASKDTVLFQRLSRSQKRAELPVDEKTIHDELEKTLPKLQAEIKSLGKRINEMKNYVFAAEGFLQVLEREPSQFIDEDREYMLEYSCEVGMIIIDCAQHGKKWEELTEDQQSLIIDFANIFENDSKARAEQLVQVLA